MSSLKEIKGRIVSVKSTQKITFAMKMIASSKLRKVQENRNHFASYYQKLNEIADLFLSSIPDYTSSLMEKREIKRIGIVVFSSNTSLCGAFNSNILKLLKEKIDQYKYLSPKNVEVYAIGKKAEEYVRRMHPFFALKKNYTEWINKPDFSKVRLFANQLIADFASCQIDKVELVYNHFKSIALQTIAVESYLPVPAIKSSKNYSVFHPDYIIEPNQDEVFNVLIPQLLQSKLYEILLDSITAEQAARVFAMQAATDNAGDLLDDLTIQYNKQRQQAITDELLDIVGGSEVLK